MKTSNILKEIFKATIYPKAYIIFTFQFPFYGYWSFKGFVDLNIKYKAYKFITNER